MCILCGICCPDFFGPAIRSVSVRVLTVGDGLNVSRPVFVRARLYFGLIAVGILGMCSALLVRKPLPEISATNAPSISSGLVFPAQTNNGRMIEMTLRLRNASNKNRHSAM